MLLLMLSDDFEKALSSLQALLHRGKFRMFFFIFEYWLFSAFSPKLKFSILILLSPMNLLIFEFGLLLSSPTPFPFFSVCSVWIFIAENLQADLSRPFMTEAPILLELAEKCWLSLFELSNYLFFLLCAISSLFFGGLIL